MARVTIYLNKDERDALQTLAEKEYRDPRLQAALMIRRELVRIGLLSAESTQPTRVAEVQRDRVAA